MATVTTQILVGKTSSYEGGGINSTHYLNFSENDRPAWSLVGQKVNIKKRTGPIRKVWIPSLDYMLDDALLMIALHVAEDPKIVNAALNYNMEILGGRFTVYDGLTEEQQLQLYSMCREMENWPKLIISVFKGSYIKRFLPILQAYPMDMEICQVTYSRLYSSWAKETFEEGALE